ncbi:MAG: type II secretion system protein [Clostridia bacterium]
MRVNFNENKGITLIALVVTIIVLLILAGISVSMLTGQNGILNRASEAKEKTAAAQKEENETLNDYEKIMDKYTSNLPSTKETMPYLPDATKFEKVSGTDLTSGLVIREKATGSEYVWVEVPKTATVYPTAGINITNFTDEEYTKIENDLHTYTSDYRNGTDYSDTYAKDETTGWFDDEEQYNELKNKMLKSIYENGGFWVGRYEAGIKENRTASGDVIAIPLTKANLYPYNWVTRTQAKVLAEKVESGRSTSSLMFGVQWDLMLAFMRNKGCIENKVLIEDSTSIGNYNNNKWKIDNTNGKYSVNSGKDFNSFPYEKKSESSVLTTTGADMHFSQMNIFDVAGNVWDFTLEKTSNVNAYCAARGGNCYNSGNECWASYRGGFNSEGQNDSIGFRIVIF